MWALIGVRWRCDCDRGLQSAFEPCALKCARSWDKTVRVWALYQNNSTPEVRLQAVAGSNTSSAGIDMSCRTHQLVTHTHTRMPQHACIFSTFTPRTGVDAHGGRASYRVQTRRQRTLCKHTQRQNVRAPLTPLPLLCPHTPPTHPPSPLYPTHEHRSQAHSLSHVLWLVRLRISFFRT